MPRLPSAALLLSTVAALGACSQQAPRSAAVRATGALTAGTPVSLVPLATGVEAGTSVALDGDLLAVGAPRDGTLLGAQGAVYVFARDAGGVGAWGLLARVVAPDGADRDAFGAAVALSGDVLVVGAPQRPTSGVREAGAVYVFLRNFGGADAFGLAAILVRSVPYAGGSFGRAVAASGDVVAASVLPLSPNTGVGEVLVFARNQGGADGFGQVRKLTTCSGATGTNYFGRSVSLSGDLLVSGDLSNPSRAGSACVFGRNEGGTDAWGLLKRVPLPESISNSSYGDDFGDAVSVSGDTLAVGAWGRNEGGQFRSGAAYVFRRDQGGVGAWGLVKKLVATPPGANDVFGSVLSLEGDVVAVAAPYASAAASHGGAVWVYERNRGGTEQWGLARKLSPALATWGAKFGGAVAASAGRVAVGAALADLAGPDSGAAALFAADQGGTGVWGEVAERGPSGTLVWDRRIGIRTGGTYVAGSQFGAAVAASGDLVIVGGPSYPLGGAEQAGAAWLFSRDRGGAGTFGGLGRLGVRDGGDWVSGSWVGWSVAVSGDVAVVGAYEADLGASDSGAAFVFLRDQGGAGAWGQAAVLRSPVAATNQLFGSGVATDGDLVAVGAPMSGSGTVYLFGRDQGGAGAFGLVKTITGPGAAVGDDFGTSVAIAGDVLVVGAPQDDDRGAGSGTVYVFLRDLGGSGAWGLASKILAPDGATWDWFGSNVAASGDVVAADAPGRDEGGVQDAGAAYVFLRNAGGADAYGLAKKLVEPTPTAGFGGSIAAGPGLVAVPGANAVYLFGRSTGGAEGFGLARTVANPSASSAGFGFVALSGSLLVVGRSGQASGWSTEPGEAWAITLSDADDCAAAPCQNGGTCTDLLGGYTCACAPGYLGADCSVFDSCTPNPCQNGGTCENGTTGPICTCAAGYTGALCEVVDHCTPSPCLNGGTCANDASGYTCACAAGWSGPNCGTNTDDCAPNPCLNGGTCTDLVNGFSCTCAVGWSGATCGTNVDECAPNPCQNGGTCTDLVNGFSCACAAGWSGATCGTNVDDCTPNPCLNGGTCTDLVNGFSCACATGWSGATCGTAVDDCTPNPCQNGGTCTDLVNGFSCACAAGWSGATCGTNVDDCTPNPCLHGGTCTDGVNAFTCACPTGFTGATCAEDVDECALGTHGCSADATCTNAVGSYTCACHAGFSGDGRTCVADSPPPLPPETSGGCGCGTRGASALELVLVSLAAVLMPRPRTRRREGGSAR